MTYGVDVGGERARDVIEYYKSKSARRAGGEIFGRRSESEQTPAAPGKRCIFTIYFIYYVGRLPRPYHRSRPVYFPIDCLGGNLYARPLFVGSTTYQRHYIYI